MKPEHYEQVLNAYVKGARNAKKIGCDALEIHGGKRGFESYDSSRISFGYLSFDQT